MTRNPSFLHKHHSLFICSYILLVVSSFVDHVYKGLKKVAKHLPVHTHEKCIQFINWRMLYAFSFKMKKIDDRVCEKNAKNN